MELFRGIVNADGDRYIDVVTDDSRVGCREDGGDGSV